MESEKLNTRLYQKMFAEQEQYRNWLLSQTPKEILTHTYEYTVREDILLALEFYDLPISEVKALLKSPSPLAEVYSDWEDKETNYMEDIWETIVQRAKTELAKQKHKEQNMER